MSLHHLSEAQRQRRRRQAAKLGDIRGKVGQQDGLPGFEEQVGFDVVGGLQLPDDLHRTDEGLSPSAWAAKHVVLDGQPWTASKLQRDVLDLMATNNVHLPDRIAWWKSAQVGATSCLLATLAYQIAGHGRKVCVAMPSAGEASKMVKGHIEPVIDDSRPLRMLLAYADRRRGAIEFRRFPNGGELRAVGTTTGKTLRSFTTDTFMLDELDGYLPSVEGEGSPVTLCARAISNRQAGRVVAVSTPASVQWGFSQIVRECERAGIMFEFHVQCPRCGALEPLAFESMVWDKRGTPEQRSATVRYLCQSCGESWRYESLPRAIDGGRWQVSPAPEGRDRAFVGAWMDGIVLRDAAGKQLPWPSRVGFAETWFAYSIWRSWESNIVEWLYAQGDEEQVLAFTQLRLARPWKHDAVKLDGNSLQSRAVDMEPLPVAAMHVTATVDVQGDRLSVLLVAHGRREAMWVFDRFEIAGDTALAHSGPWQALERWVADRPYWQRADRRWLPLGQIGVDAGHRQSNVLRAMRHIQHRHRYSLKGDGGDAAPDIREPTMVALDGVRHPLHVLGANTLKRVVLHRLSEGKLIKLSKRLNAAVFDELSSETLTLVKGKWRFVKPPRRDNEALDCLYYALGLVRTARPNWDRFERYFAAKPQSDVSPTKAVKPESAPAVPAAPTVAPRRRRRMIAAPPTRRQRTARP